MTTQGPTSRERVLRAAAEVFGERGFKAATVREICRRGDVALAAVNYYFRDKEGLYQAVLEGLMQQAFDRYPIEYGLVDAAGPRERLRAIVRAFLLRLVAAAEGDGARERSVLLAREIAEPSPAMNTLIERFLKPQRDLLFAVVRELLGPGASEEDVSLCSLSVAGQCLHYVYAWPIIQRLAGMEIGSDVETIERLARHIAEFSLGGISRRARRNRSARLRREEANS